VDKIHAGIFAIKFCHISDQLEGLGLKYDNKLFPLGCLKKNNRMYNSKFIVGLALYE